MTARDEQIATFARSAIPYAKIGALFGLSKQRVYAIAKEAGISRCPQRARHNHVARVLTDEQLRTLTVEKVIQHLENGWLSPGYQKGTPEQRAAASKQIAAWLRSQLPEAD